MRHCQRNEERTGRGQGTSVWKGQREKIGVAWGPGLDPGTQSKCWHEVGGHLEDLLTSFMKQTRAWMSGRGTKVTKGDTPQAASTAPKGQEQGK